MKGLAKRWVLRVWLKGGGLNDWLKGGGIRVWLKGRWKEGKGSGAWVKPVKLGKDG